MIPELAEVLRALYGASRLLRLDPQGLSWFATTSEDFWKSFFAAVIVAPAYILLLVMHYATMEEPPAAGLLEMVLLQALAYAIAWLAFPLAAYHLCRIMGREGRFVLFIVASNWLSVPLMAIYLPAAALGWSGYLGGLGDFLQLLALFAVLFYLGFTARTTLAVSLPAAAAFVALNLLLDILIDDLVRVALS